MGGAPIGLTVLLLTEHIVKFHFISLLRHLTRGTVIVSLQKVTLLCSYIHAVQ